MTDWVVPNRETDKAKDLVRTLGVSPVTAHLLVRMGYEGSEDAESFLRPALGDLIDPGGFPDMEKATARLEGAIQRKETILLFGDYDVDGTTGAAVLFEVLGNLGAEVVVHIPDRHEGYGVNLNRLEQAVREGVKVVITIDNGIAALEEAAFCKAHGLDLIVADHHTFGDVLPEATALIHPRLPGAVYENPNLCGAGVAFKVAWALAARMGPEGRPSKKLQEVLLRCLSLVALGTIADVVPLVGENRIIVRYGLRALTVRPTAGLRALLDVSRVEGPLDSHVVAFRLAPRLNAAGRMGVARRAFDLIVSDDEEAARALAEELDAENKKRRGVQKRVYEQACKQVKEAYGERIDAAGIVVWDEGWPHGIVGIVAAKLTETFGRPALIASVDGDSCKGSGRSMGGVDLLGSLEPSRDLFVRMGGHAAAVGFTIETSRLSELREAFSAGVKQLLGLGDEAQAREVVARLGGYEVEADVEVELGEISRDLLDELEQLSPFGAGNPEPLFTASSVTIAGQPRLMGKTGDHVSFNMRQGDRVFRTVAFGRRDVFELLQEKAGQRPEGARSFQVAFKPRLNRWNGQAKVELELAAIREESAETD